MFNKNWHQPFRTKCGEMIVVPIEKLTVEYTRANLLGAINVNRIDDQYICKLCYAVVHAADVQDRDGAPDVLKAIRHRFPWLRHVFADGGYAGDKLRAALAKIGKWTMQIIRRSDAAKGFEILPRRWVVERTFAWLNRNRRLAKDFEKTLESATAWLFMASVQMIARRIATY